MTRREKSDAQLDAEAAGTPIRRSFHVDPLSGDLDELVREHRNYRRDDAYIEKLVGRQPPTTRDPNTGVVHQHEASRVGMNMSARLYRYVESAPPQDFPWHSGFRRLRSWCRRDHKEHRGADVPYYRGSLCQEAVRLVVMGPEGSASLPGQPLSPDEAAQILRVRIGPVLRLAFAYIEACMDEAHRKSIFMQREDAGRFEWDAEIPVHRPLDGLHKAECPQCRRNAA